MVLVHGGKGCRWVWMREGCWATGATYRDTASLQGCGRHGMGLNCFMFFSNVILIMLYVYEHFHLLSVFLYLYFEVQRAVVMYSTFKKVPDSSLTLLVIPLYT